MDLTSDPGATCSSELAAENWGTQASWGWASLACAAASSRPARSFPPGSGASAAAVQRTARRGQRVGRVRRAAGLALFMRLSCFCVPPCAAGSRTPRRRRGQLGAAVGLPAAEKPCAALTAPNHHPTPPPPLLLPPVLQPETIYTCMITDSVAAAVMVTDSLYVRCGAEGGNATANSTEPAEGMVMARKLLMDDMEGMGAEEGAVCEVGLKTGPSFGDAMIRCQATGCVPGEGGVGVTCQDTACTCPEDETCGNGERSAGAGECTSRTGQSGRIAGVCSAWGQPGWLPGLGPPHPTASSPTTDPPGPCIAPAPAFCATPCPKAPPAAAACRHCERVRERRGRRGQPGVRCRGQVHREDEPFGHLQHRCRVWAVYD